MSPLEYPKRSTGKDLSRAITSRRTTPDTPEITSIRTYSIELLVLLFVMHLFAFLVMRTIEMNDLRNELIDASRTLQISNEDLESDERQTVRYPNGIVLFEGTDSHDHRGFYETSMNRDNYLVYANPENNRVVAKSEKSVSDEVSKFALVIGILFIGEVVVLIGWWMFFKGKVKELFVVT